MGRMVGVDNVGLNVEVGIGVTFMDVGVAVMVGVSVGCAGSVVGGTAVVEGDGSGLAVNVVRFGRTVGAASSGERSVEQASIERITMRLTMSHACQWDSRHFFTLHTFSAMVGSMVLIIAEFGGGPG
jgi:hypothetical protein